MDVEAMPRTTARNKHLPLVNDGFPTRLRLCRRKRMWSLPEAAAAFNRELKSMGSQDRITARSVGEWERGERRPSLGPRMQAIARTYGVSGTWLLVGEEDEE